MTRCVLLAALAACGGAGGLTIDDPMPDVQIANPSCQIIGTDMADIMVEGLVTLAEGNVITGDFILAGPPVASVSGFFSCGSWDELFDAGQNSVGCIRNPGAPISMQAVNISHDVTVSGTLSDPTMVNITLRVTDGRGGTQLTSKSMIVACSTLN